VSDYSKDMVFGDLYRLQPEGTDLKDSQTHGAVGRTATGFETRVAGWPEGNPVIFFL